MKGMILAAGVGSRLKTLTSNTPKALVKVGEYRMIELCIAYLKKHGVDELIINVHHMADQMMEFVSEMRWQGINISISDETDELLNTGGGLQKASAFFDGEKDFVLMAVDILTDLDLSAMIIQHQHLNSLVTLAVKERDTSRNLLFDKNGLLSGWIHNETREQKTVSGKEAIEGLAFSGVHIISTDIFNLVEEKGAFSIVDLYLRLAEKQELQKFEHGGIWLEFGREDRMKKLTQSAEFSQLITDLFA